MLLQSSSKRGEITGSDMFVHNIEVGMPMRSFVDQSRKSSYQLESKQYHDNMLKESNDIEQISYFDPLENISSFDMKDQANVQSIYNQYTSIIIQKIQHSKQKNYIIDLVSFFTMIEFLFLSTNNPVFQRIFPELNKYVFHQEFTKFIETNNLIRSNHKMYTLIEESNNLNKFFIQQNTSVRQLTQLNSQTSPVVSNTIQNSLKPLQANSVRYNSTNCKSIDIDQTHLSMIDVIQSPFFIHTSIETEVSSCGNYLNLYNGEYHIVRDGSIIKVPLNNNYSMMIIQDQIIDDIQSIIHSNGIFKLVPIIRIPFIKQFSKIDCRSIMSLIYPDSSKFNISNLNDTIDAIPITLYQFNNIGVFPYTIYQNLDGSTARPNIDMGSNVYVIIYNQDNEIIHYFGYIR